MNLIEAVKAAMETGRRFERKGTGDSLYVEPEGGSILYGRYNQDSIPEDTESNCIWLSSDDILADDWELVSPDPDHLP